MTKILMLALAVFVPAKAHASGSVHCAKSENSLPLVSLSWGAGHVEGSGRISPYRLTLSGREILVTEKMVREVGYWIDQDQILVRLADDQIEQTKLLLTASRDRRHDNYHGTLTISDLEGVSIRDLKMICTRE
jgi:hypothetical protein